jgi:flavin reductase (DIM6/NTAB) family NADH-FMN oxidoreductase RutF
VLRALATEPANVGADEYRRAARRLAGGLTLAMARHGEDVHAVTATGFSLSLSPALVFLSLDAAGQMIRLVTRAGHIGVSILDRRHAPLARWASIRGRPMRLLPEMLTVTAHTGAPLLPDALAWFDCSLADVLHYGDHAIVVARVVATWSRDDGSALIYVDRAYHAVGDVLTDPLAEG